MSLENSILDFIDVHGDATLAGLAEIPGFKGEKHYVSKSNPNIILWSGISSEAVSALEHMLSSKLIKIMPVEPMVYLIDGMALNLPIATSKRKYKTPHWLPVCFVRAKAS